MLALPRLRVALVDDDENDRCPHACNTDGLVWFRLGVRATATDGMIGASVRRTLEMGRYQTA